MSCCSAQTLSTLTLSLTRRQVDGLKEISASLAIGSVVVSTDTPRSPGASVYGAGQSTGAGGSGKCGKIRNITL
jgi:hypothetical protein